jgi:group I intron endonuclease
MNSIGLVYKAINRLNNKSYIGCTAGSLQKRMNQHLKDSRKRNNKFHNALRKYGIENFVWEILYDNIPLEHLEIAEICAIYTYDTFYTGYNSTSGGEFKKIYSEETRQKISQAGKGRVSWSKGRHNIFSAETLKQMSDKKQGYIPWNKGVTGYTCHRSSESLERAKNRMLGNTYTLGIPGWNKGKGNSETSICPICQKEMKKYYKGSTKKLRITCSPICRAQWMSKVMQNNQNGKR